MKKLFNKLLLMGTFMFMFSGIAKALPCPKGIVKYGLRNTSSFMKKVSNELKNNKKIPARIKKRLWKYALNNKIQTLLLVYKCIKTYVNEQIG